MLRWLMALLLGLILAAVYWLVERRRASARVPSPRATPASPGGAAIDQALDELYPSEREFRFALSPEPGEEAAPLAEIVAYRASKPVPHWHYVTYGLSELGEKTSPDSSLSGWGVEYTLRLVDDSAELPVWPMNLLRWLAKFVWQNREPLDPLHSINVPAGLLDAVSPGVEGLGFLADSALGTIQTPNGSLAFVTVIPLMKRECWLLGAWDFGHFVEAVRIQQGDLLWRVGRPSVLEGERGQELLARAARDGSSRSLNFADLAWTDGEFVLDPLGREVVISCLRYRLAYDRNATVVSEHRKTTLSPGDWRIECADGACAAAVPQDAAGSLADDLEGAAPGTTVVRPNGLRFRIEASE